MLSSSVRKFLASSFVVAMVALIISVALAYTQAGNQLIREADVATAVGDGTLINSGSCTWGTNIVLTRVRLVTCIQNNGACAGATNIVVTWQAITGCKVTSGLVALSTDGVAEGATTCNAACISGGGSASPAIDWVATSASTVTTNDASHAITWNITRANESSGCTLTIKEGTTTLLATTALSASGNISGSYTSGTTGGTITATFHDSASSGGTPICTNTGSITYYH